MRQTAEARILRKPTAKESTHCWNGATGEGRPPGCAADVWIPFLWLRESEISEINKQIYTLNAKVRRKKRACRTAVINDAAAEHALFFSL